MFAQKPLYLPLKQCPPQPDLPYTPFPSSRTGWRDVAISLLLIANVVLGSLLIKSNGNRSSETAVNAFGLDVSFSKELEWKGWAAYHSKNETEYPEVEAAWDSINDEHGVVALDRVWAEQQGLPASMVLPSQPNKAIYYLEAYHQLHCAIQVRRGFLNLLAGKPLDWPLAHYRHCHAAIVESILCTPSDNLIFTFGHLEINQTQTRKCRNWDAFRDWAGQHSACDPNDVKGLNHAFESNLCHGNSDGVVIA